MRIKAPKGLENLSSWEELRTYVSINLLDLIADYNGSVDIIDNLKTYQASVVFPGANMAVKVTHTLGVKPRGYIVVGKSANINVFDSTQNQNSSIFSTENEIFLQASGAGTASVLIY